jgi:hypothetical protein
MTSNQNQQKWKRKNLGIAEKLDEAGEFFIFLAVKISSTKISESSKLIPYIVKWKENCVVQFIALFHQECHHDI